MKTERARAAHKCGAALVRPDARRTRRVFIALAGLLALPLAALGMDLSRKVEFNIPAQSLDAALLQFSQQSRIQVIVSGDIRGAETKGVNGQRAIKEALSELLTPAGLGYQVASEDSITVGRMNSAASIAGGRGKDSILRLAQNTNGQSQNDSELSRPQEGDKDGAGSPEALEEIVVTGTHIRGNTAGGSPLITITRAEIERSGSATTKDILERIPQNFSGAASENTISSVTGGGRSVNQSNSSAVNLRGLGPDATLVLVNGRRVAPGNVRGNFVDVSTIPVAAIERVEIVPDGASAVYGADAVGGVVNFILRRDFAGQESSLRFGSVTHGDSREYQASHTIGGAWAGGSALASLEYYRRTSLDAADRSYTRDASSPFTLLPEQERESLFLNLNQSVGEIEFFGTALAAHRDTENVASTIFFQQRNPSDIDSYNVTGGAQFRLGSAAAEASVSYGLTDTQARAISDGSTLASHSDVRTDLVSADFAVRGLLFDMASGALQYAIGGQLRSESLRRRDFLANDTFDPDRSVSAIFGEVSVPIRNLTLDLAVRHEDYSDFGSTTNPRVGLVWTPTEAFSLRGTWGKSFKAPLLIDMDPIPGQVISFPLPSFSGGTDDCAPFDSTSTCTNTTIVFGGNPNLDAERAETWSVGVDFRAKSQTGPSASLSYFDIHYTNKIDDPGFTVDVFSALGQINLLGTSIVNLSPSLADVQALFGSPNAENPLGFAPEDIGAILDLSVRNLGVVNTQGVDIDLAYRWASIAKLEAGISGTHLTQFDTQFTSTSPTIDVLNTAYNPIDLRLRGRFSADWAAFTAAAYVNFVDSYKDNRVSPAVSIGSWTTMDLSLAYRFGGPDSENRSQKLQIGVTNLFDKSPPFVSNPTFGINFDGANASALGRFAYLQLRARW